MNDEKRRIHTSRSIEETRHLLRSRKNAERLLAALFRARKGVGTPQTIEKLRREMELDETERTTARRNSSGLCD